MLAYAAKENVSQWQFCAPSSKKEAKIVLHYEYQLKGRQINSRKRADAVIDLGKGTVVVTANPPHPEP